MIETATQRTHKDDLPTVSVSLSANLHGTTEQLKLLEHELNQ